MVWKSNLLGVVPEDWEKEKCLTEYQVSLRMLEVFIVIRNRCISCNACTYKPNYSVVLHHPLLNRKEELDPQYLGYEQVSFPRAFLNLELHPAQSPLSSLALLLRVLRCYDRHHRG
jgi:hypothetical protein